MKLLELNRTEFGGDFINQVTYSEEEMYEVFNVQQNWDLRNGEIVEKGNLRYIECTAAARKAGLFA